jgi:hypothetical protein
MVARAPTLAKSVEYARLFSKTRFRTVALGGAVAPLLLSYGSVAYKRCRPAVQGPIPCSLPSADRRLEQASEFPGRECMPSGRDRAKERTAQSARDCAQPGGVGGRTVGEFAQQRIAVIAAAAPIAVLAHPAFQIARALCHAAVFAS